MSIFAKELAVQSLLIVFFLLSINNAAAQQQQQQQPQSRTTQGVPIVFISAVTGNILAVVSFLIGTSFILGLKIQSAASIPQIVLIYHSFLFSLYLQKQYYFQSESYVLHIEVKVTSSGKFESNLFCIPPNQDQRYLIFTNVKRM